MKTKAQIIQELAIIHKLLRKRKLNSALRLELEQRRNTLNWVLDRIMFDRKLLVRLPARLAHDKFSRVHPIGQRRLIGKDGGK